MVTGLENLKIYNLAEELEIYVHKITKDFPPDEKFRSIDQLRRSSSSVSNNIAESYGRFSYGEKIQRMYTARGEAEETQRGIIKCYKKNFISKKTADFISSKYVELLKGINGYIKFLYKERTKKQKPE